MNYLRTGVTTLQPISIKKEDIDDTPVNSNYLWSYATLFGLVALAAAFFRLR